MNHYRQIEDGTQYCLPNKQLAARFDDCIESDEDTDLSWAEEYVVVETGPKQSKRELNKKKAALTYKITNLRADYSSIDKDDIPEEVTAELKEMIAELLKIKEELAARE